MTEKLDEARRLVVDGNKAENKTSFFGKKKPDWESALTNYESAANLFKSCKAHQEAVDSLIKVAECHKNLSSLFMAAKALEGAAHITYQQLNQSELAGDLYKKTSDYYLAHGSADRAAESLERAAKAWETADSAKAIQFYTEALDLIESEDRPRAGIDIFKRAISYSTKCAAWDVAIGFSKRLTELYIKLDQKHYLSKSILTTIILCLRKDDVVQSKTVYQNHSSGNFGGSEEAKIADMLLEAIEDGNVELLQTAVQSSTVKFLENEIAKSALSLKVHPKREAGGFTQKAEAQDLQDEIEDEGFL